MNNFGHIETIKLFFFSKCSKFYVEFENAIKLGEYEDGFEDNSLWTYSWSFLHLWKQYMWYAVTVSKSGFEIPVPTKRHATQHNLFDINGTLA